MRCLAHPRQPRLHVSGPLHRGGHAYIQVPRPGANGCTREAVGALSMQMCSPAGGPQRQREGLGAGAAGGAHERRALELEFRSSRRQEGIARGHRSALQRLHDQGSCPLSNCVCRLQVGLRMHVNFSMRTHAEARMLIQSNMGVLHTTLRRYSQQVGRHLIDGICKAVRRRRLQLGCPARRRRPHDVGVPIPHLRLSHSELPM